LAPHQVNELAKADGHAIAIAAYANGVHGLVGQQCSGGTDGMRPCTELKLNERDMKVCRRL